MAFKEINEHNSTLEQANLITKKKNLLKTPVKINLNFIFHGIQSTTKYFLFR